MSSDSDNIPTHPAEEQGPCGFSIQHYGEILETGLKHGYKFIGYDELTALPAGQKACILRHDIDYMPEWALRFAETEDRLAIKATYFFQVCAKTYNLRESGNYRTVRQLSAMGHTTGLHFDPSWKDDPRREEVASACEQDKENFRVITGTEPCEIISFHNPHRYMDLVLDQHFPGIRHTYEPAFFSSIKYLSDSQGWYEGCMCRVFASGKYDVIQLLLHPYIWPDVASGNFIRDMARMVKLRADELTDYLVDYHPVCRKNEAQLRSEVAHILAGTSPE